MTPPGQASCDLPITDLNSIVACVDCVTELQGHLRRSPPGAGVHRRTRRSATPARRRPASGPCPSTISFTADGPNVDLDTGFTGLAHDAQVPTNGRITLAVSGCAGVNQPTCGQCNVTGPLANDGGVTFNNQRCQDAPWVQCTSDADCTNATSCVGGANNGALVLECFGVQSCAGGQ